MPGPRYITQNELETDLRRLRLSIAGAGITMIPPAVESVKVFTDLDDAPATYAAAGNFVVRVKSTVDGLEFAELKGTTNQVVITPGAADYVWSLPQDIHTAATPTFAGLTLNVASGDPDLHFAIGGTTKFTMGVDDSDADSFKLSAGAVLGTTDILKITAAYWVGLNESANVNMTAGLTINQGAADDEILALKSSDVWNGLDVAWVEADTYAQFLKIAGATGGLNIRGYGEGATGLQLEGFGWTGIVDTGRLTTSTGIINLVAHEVNYNGSVEMALSANVNLLAIRHGLTPTTVWILDVEGDTWQAGSINVAGAYEVDGVQVVGTQVVDDRIDDAINAAAWDSTTAGVLDAMRDAMITHGLMAAA